MSEVLEFYQQQAQACLSSIPWLAALQKKALSDFNHYGFPTRHQEDWKYTVMDAFLQQRFASREAVAPKNSAALTSDIPVGQRLDICNGQVLDCQQLSDQLPSGVVVQSLSQVLQYHPELIKGYLGQLLRHEHGFQALNSAILDSGVVIYLPAGVCLEQPIVLNHWQDQNDQSVHARHLIIAEAGSQATIIEDYQGAQDCSYLTNTITEVFLAADAKVVHYKIQRESSAAFHLGHISAKLDKAALFDSHSLSLGGKIVRSDMTIALQQEQADVRLNGIYAPGDKQHVDHHTSIYHLVPNCHSEQDYKGILKGHSRAVFNGRIIVAKDAQHTNAQQQNKNLLLSAQAEIDTKPQLEIFADDVICSHGTTVGQLDEDALFYLATRGIGRVEASRYLIHAFAADNLRRIPDRQLAEWMAVLINQHLG